MNEQFKTKWKATFDTRHQAKELSDIPDNANVWVNGPCKPSFALRHMYVVLRMHSEQCAYCYVTLTFYCATPR